MFDMSFPLSLKFGALFALWEAFEIGYAFARWKRFFSYEEFVVVLDIVSWRLKPYATIAIHVFRIVMAITLIITGSII